MSQQPSALANVEENGGERPTTPDRSEKSAHEETPLKLLNRRRAKNSKDEQEEHVDGEKENKGQTSTAEPSEWASQARWAMQTETASSMRAEACEFVPVPGWPSSVELAPPPGLDLEPNSMGDSMFQNEEVMEPPLLQNSSNQSGVGSRHEKVVQLICDALSSHEAVRWKDSDGFVPLSKLLRVWPELQRAAFGSTKVIVQAVEQGSGIIRLDQERRRVRLQSCEDVILSIVEQEIEQSLEKSLPWSALVGLQSLKEHIEEGKSAKEDPKDFLYRVLNKEGSKVIVRGKHVTLRPRREQLRRIVEEVFTDSHLSQDQRLRTKIAEAQGGGVPLTWFCSKYAERLGNAPGEGARSAEGNAAELCDALRDSELLVVDTKRWTITRRTPVRLSPGSAGRESGKGNSQLFSPVAKGVRDSPPSAQSERQRGAGSARAAVQLRQLLDFYFEPFSLQHNRYILDLIARRIGVPKEAGPWVVEALSTFRFTVDDLLGLGRIKSALEKLNSAGEQSDLSELLGQLKFLRADGRSFKLLSPPEIRSFVASASTNIESADATARHLSAAREQRGQAPDGMLSVLSCAITASLFDDTELGAQRLGRLKRQLTLHHADIICLQNLDADNGAGSNLAATLSEEGYAFACAKCEDGAEANSIFWDRSRLEYVAMEECGSAMCIDLKPFEGPKDAVRAICFRPRVPTTQDGERLKKLFRGPEKKLVCADLSLLGGAHGASVMEELSSMFSVSQEVLGAEISIPRVGQDLKPLRAAASGMNKLHCPDSVLFCGMSPIVALSGHTEGHLSTLSAENFQHQFPAFRMPLVAAFDRRKKFEPQQPKIANFGNTRHRL